MKTNFNGNYKTGSCPLFSAAAKKRKTKPFNPTRDELARYVDEYKMNGGTIHVLEPSNICCDDFAFLDIFTDID